MVVNAKLVLLIAAIVTFIVALLKVSVGIDLEVLGLLFFAASFLPI